MVLETDRRVDKLRGGGSGREMSYQRYCTICGEHYESNQSSMVCCSLECCEIYGEQQREYAEKILAAAVPEALEVLGYETLEDYAEHKRLKAEGKLGVVYFIQQGNDGLIKIGTTENIKTRLSSLQTSSPRPLNLLATIDGGRWKETELHTRFAEFRKTGEWFEPVQELLDYIATV